jgi:FtsP/CotA-like multicopper oxidase with cupredoxin domain
MKNTGIRGHQSNLRRSPVAHACLTFSMLLATGAVHAAAGFGDTNDANGAPIRAQTYYAHTPSGVRAALPPEAAGIMGATYTGNTGKALRKFVDPLPQIGKPGTLADGTTSKYIPKAKPVPWTNPNGVVTGDEYYEIAVVEYTEKLHSDLKNPTRLRGYVQIDQEASNGRAPLAGSKSVALTYPNGTAITIPGTDANGKLTGAMVAAVAYDNPHYLGPAIVSTRGIATRLKFHNLLPVGRYDAATGRNGDLFLPVDETLAGAGVGPDSVTRYTQNRAEIHLHGGDNPWISDGTPHQWIAPAGERAKLSAEMSKAGSPLPVDTFLRGPGAINVPDMNDPGEGAMTYYFPNKQSARMEWYHDHTYGLTRLNVYAGMAAPYILNDAGQDAMLQTVSGFPTDTIHLVIQDKTFVPEDVLLQDGRWNARVVPDAANPGKTKNVPLATPLWGEASDMWYPHVYEVNQDPSNGLDGTNPVGRWDWGPYFWPVFPSLYNLPTGGVDDVTLTPEAWMDTPMVNGVAYPTITVQPRAQRLKILNAGNDRFWNLSFFLADSAISEIQVPAGQGGAGYAATDVVTINASTGSGATASLVVDAAGTITAIRVTNAGTGYSSVPGVTYPTISIASATGSGAAPVVVVADSTEVKMVPAVPANASGLAACAQDANGVDIAFPAAAACWPSTWPTDGRDGGVPDPRTNGPTMYQIGNEAGLLPQVAEIVPQPMQYEYNRRSITVLNTFITGLFMGNAERADVVVDFSPYAGKTLIMYSDAPAPVPAFDPRNDHWTGKPDETAVGSVDTPQAGFGPNTRTVMQFKVDNSPAVAAALIAAAQADLLAAQNTLSLATATAAADQAAANAKLALSTTAAAKATTDAAAKTDALNALLAFIAAADFTSPAFNAAATTYANAVILSNASDAAAALAAGTFATAQAKADASAQAVVTAQAGVDVATAALATAQAAAPNFLPLDLAGLKATLPKVYGDPVVGQELPIVAQSTYNAAFNKTWSDAPQTDGTKAFATIFTGSLQEPSFRFTPGTPNGAFDKLTVLTGGLGYRTPPVPVIDAPAAGGVQATANSTLRVGMVNVINPGAGFKYAPTVTFTNTGVGSGASAVARMQVSKVLVANGGSGYTSAPVVTFSAPDSHVPGAAQAYGTAVLTGGVVTSITIDVPGNGYTSAPLVGIEAPAAGVRATASSELNIKTIDLISNDPNHPEFAGGAGYANMGTVTVAISAPTAPGAVAATAGVIGAVSDITLLNPGRGYAGIPNVTFPTPVGGIAATAVAQAGGGSILVKNKAIQELFDPTYGRMNATLGVEIPFTSAMTQTTVPLGYVDQVTEEFADGETQIWKITHNGVDAHPVHFHLLNVQVINRVGWDGTIKPPHSNEYGWKETLVMSPLEDILVAVRAKKPVLPGFGLPFSQRLRDPSQPDGVPMGFTQINPLTGAPALMTNQMDNFGWEYVWHCHILGHEENDFMRPVKFNANEVVPAAASGLAFNGNVLNWADNASTEYRYEVYKVVTTGAGIAAVATPTLVSKPLANATSADVGAVTPGANYAVVAVGANGSTGTLLTAPAAITAPVITATALTGARTATFTFQDKSTNEVSFAPAISADGGLTWRALPAVGVTTPGRMTGTTQTYTVNLTGLNAGTTYLVGVTARGTPVSLNGLDMTATSAPVTAPLVFAAPDAPTLSSVSALALVGTLDTATLTFAKAATGLPLVSYQAQYAVATTAAAQATPPVAGWVASGGVIPAAATSVTLTNLPRGTAANPTAYVGTAKYWFRIVAVNQVGGTSSTPAVLSADFAK